MKTEAQGWVQNGSPMLRIIGNEEGLNQTTSLHCWNYPGCHPCWALCAVCLCSSQKILRKKQDIFREERSYDTASPFSTLGWLSALIIEIRISSRQRQSPAKAPSSTRPRKCLQVTLQHKARSWHDSNMKAFGNLFGQEVHKSLLILPGNTVLFV